MIIIPTPTQLKNQGLEIWFCVLGYFPVTIYDILQVRTKIFLTAHLTLEKTVNFNCDSYDLFLFSLGVPCEFFWELCDRIKNCGLLPSNGITIPGKIALFLIRQRQGTSFKFLQDLLLMNRDILSDTYYEVLFCYKSLYNHQYTIWNNRYMSLQSKDELYQAQFLNFEKITNKFVQNLDFYKSYKTFCDI